jgi:hypothetical protein
MHRPRRGASRLAGARGRALAVALAVGFSSALPAGVLAGQGPRPRTVRFRFLLANLVYNAPLRGSFTASGAIVDHGTASGLLWPVYHTSPDGSA